MVWESDENPRKVQARQMVFMVQAINRENFSGRQEVTCWTCHRLRVTPVQTPHLDTFYGEAITELDDVVSKAEGVPSPAQVIDKVSLQAIGGAEKATGITSITATGKVVAFGSFGGGGSFEYFAQAPDKRAHAQSPSGRRAAAGPSTGVQAGSRFRSRSCPSIR